MKELRKLQDLLKMEENVPKSLKSMVVNMKDVRLHQLPMEKMKS
jgi:hypothetical protein